MGGNLATVDRGSATGGSVPVGDEALVGGMSEVDLSKSDVIDEFGRGIGDGTSVGEAGPGETSDW